MTKGSSFIGKWVWEKSNKDEKYIEFFEGKSGIEMRVHIEGKLWEDFKRLNLVVEKDDKGNIESYVFHNGWLSPDGKKYFQCETSTRTDMGNFVNAMEFEIVNENKLKHLIMGYRFDEVKDKWYNFKEKAYLTRF